MMKTGNYTIHGRGRKEFHPTARDYIDKIEPPFTQRDVRHAFDLIDTETEQVRDAERASSLSEMEQARNRHGLLAPRVEENRPRLEEAERELEVRKADRGSPTLGTFGYLFFVVCVGAEYSITLSTLPFLLNINRNSGEAHMLALAVVSAMMILKMVIGRLVWEPWEEARTRLGLRHRKVIWAIAVVFLLFVGTMTVYMMSKISVARSEATKALQNANRTDDQPLLEVDLEKVDAAVYVVSICLAINGALLFVIGHTEFRKVLAYLRSLIVCRRLRSRQKKLEEALSNAKTDLAKRCDDWERVDERATLASEHHRNGLIIHLEQSLKRRPARRSNREVIADLLASEFESR
ncbi:MAG: hypothetical protein AB1631_23340 [Acidobacteriota bacterium]